jgi:hypothetical protein
MANEQNARIIWDYLKYNLGLDDLRAAAIMGNISQESGFETGTESFDGEGSFGFAQWTYDRRTALEALGGNPANLDTQLQHFTNEISEGGARRYAFVNLMNNDGDLTALTNGWCDDFEAPSEEYANRQNRIDEAQRYLNMFGGGGSAAYTGTFGDMFAPLAAQVSNGVLYGDPTPDYEDGYDDAIEDIGTLRAAAENFWDSVTTSGIAKTLEYTWGGIAHSGKWWYEKKDPITQEDIDFVQKALPNDKDAQQFILLNGRDRQEVQWLVNQKLVEKNRKAMVEKWRENNDSIIARGLVTVGGAVGYFVDPLNLVPMGSAVKGSMLLGRLGTALLNPAKAKTIAALTAKSGLALAKQNAPIAGSTLVNDYLKETFSGEQQNYAVDAAVAMLAGTVLSVGGYGIGKAFSKYGARNTLTDEVAAIADNAETAAYRHAAGETAEKIRNETIGQMRELHDASFGQRLKSSVYEGFEKNGRVIATSYEKARVAVSRITGRELPKDAKAFYVPNEDYAVLITDNIKDAAQVESLLAHEFAVHAGLFESLGKQEYSPLMNQVKQAMNQEGSVFNALRRKYDTQDPEEVFAHAVEEGVLPDGILSKLKGIFNKALGREGYQTKLTADDIKDILKAQAQQTERNAQGFYVNEDGSTAFAGVRYSRDNLLNPNLFYDLYDLEPSITKDTQKDLPSLLRWIGRKFESGTAGATPFGLMINSKSNTARAYAPRIFADARGRGIGNVKTATAEEQKEWIVRRLSVHIGEYADERWAWMCANKKLSFRSAQLTFDKMVQMHYNAKYAGNKACVLADVPAEVERAAEAVRRYREEQIEIGKNSAAYFGSSSENLIDKDWYDVDFELWRSVDTDARARFFGYFNSKDAAMKNLEEYYRTFAKRDVIRAKIERDIKMKNARIDAKNTERAARGLEPLEKVDENITDDMVEKWLEARIPTAVQHALAADLDPLAAGNIKELGNLNFLQTRIPMDTSGVMTFNKGTPNEFTFSFDNNLRSYDLDSLMQKNMQRFAGEVATKNVFGTEKNLTNFLAAVKSELEASIAHGDSNASVMKEYTRMKEAIAELRGQRPREDTLSQMGVLARLMQNVSYVKNGANMGFSQLGEIGGAIAYGGAARIFGAIPMLRDLVMNIRHGKVSAEAYRRAERYMFGRAMEAEIWGVNYADRVARDALTEKGSTLNKGLIFVSDVVQQLGKVTSTLNMLPKMTDSMYRDMRTGFLVDAVDWAAGKEFSKMRNPFSEAKMKASHVTEDMAQRIKDNLNAAVRKDGKGNTVSIDMEGWMKSDPESYFKFYSMGETQAQRAIVSGTRQGNKNFLKNANWFTRMLFQFKDYNLRALNAQTMRALTARELDDMIAFGMSMATNIGAYALRIGAKAAGMYALGDVTGANDYMKRMFDEGQLLRIAATRSAFQAPLSFGNDAYEMLYGAPTIRTTVDRQQRRGKNQSFEDNIADAIKQLPAIQTGVSLKGLTALPDILTGDASQKDLKDFYKALPIPNFIPFMTYIDHVIGGSGLPKK